MVVRGTGEGVEEEKEGAEQREQEEGHGEEEQEEEAARQAQKSPKFRRAAFGRPAKLSSFLCERKRLHAPPRASSP